MRLKEGTSYKTQNPSQKPHLSCKISTRTNMQASFIEMGLNPREVLKLLELRTNKRRPFSHHLTDKSWRCGLARNCVSLKSLTVRTRKTSAARLAFEERARETGEKKRGVEEGRNNCSKEKNLRTTKPCARGPLSLRYSFDQYLHNCYQFLLLLLHVKWCFCNIRWP